MTQPTIYQKIREAVDAIQNRSGITPEIGIILGSGLGAIAEQLTDSVVMAYTEIPHFHGTSVEGHAGQMILGKFQGIPAVILQGRFHLYEGYSMEDVVFPTRTVCGLGVQTLLLTNAAGGINTRFRPGDLMLIEDHINWHQMEENERAALSQVFKQHRGVEFYDRPLRKLAREASINSKVHLHEGVYLSLPGPAYETRSEILMFRSINVDAVGMSTIPEAIWAKALDMKVLGISCITNSTYFAKAMSETSHEEVVTIAKKASKNIDTLLKAIISNIIF